jgi:hypothetical protein
LRDDGEIRRHGGDRERERERREPEDQDGAPLVAAERPRALARSLRDVRHARCCSIAVY